MVYNEHRHALFAGMSLKHLIVVFTMIIPIAINTVLFNICVHYLPVGVSNQLS